MRRTILIMTLAALSFRALAIPDQKSVFSHLSVAEGLSQCTVSSIAQDRHGMMWIATFDGLNRYDGYDFTVYRHIDGDNNSIGGDVIRKVFVDANGTVWAGTNKGLSWYDEDQDIFHNVISEDIHNFFEFTELPGDVMLVTSSRETYAVDTRLKKQIKSDLPVISLGIRAFAKVGNGMLAGNGKGELYLLEKGCRKATLLNYNFGRFPITRILTQTEELIWVATEGGGLFRVNTTSGEMKEFRHEELDESTICSNHVRDLAFDFAGNLWVGTGDNLSIIDLKTEYISNIRYDQMYPESISHVSIKTIFRDNAGGIWLGTYFGGVNYYHQLRDNFRKFNFNGGRQETIGCIKIDERGDFWIGTNRNGVMRYSPKERKLFQLPMQDANRFSSRENLDIKSIAFNENISSIYIGAAFGGLKEYRTSSGDIIRHNSDIRPASVQAILMDSDNTMWIGSLSGFFHYDLNTRKYTKVDMSGITGDRLCILSLERDSMGEVWIGTESGLVRCLPRVVNGVPCAGNGEYFDDVRWVADIHESSDKVIWFASMNGLYRYNRLTDSAPVKVGIPDMRCNVLKGIEHDASGRLWISTENGLSCYDPYTGGVCNYSSDDGLPFNMFTMYSHAKDKDGTLYFGGIGGIVYFSPERIRESNESPSPVITSLQVPGSDERIRISNGEVTLGPHSNRFAIRFSVPDYTSWKESRFQYRMLGVESDWVNADLSRTAYYSNLPKGKYTFEVRSANNCGVWCATPTRLMIKVRPVWYRTTFAAIVFTLLILTAIFFALREQRLRAERKNQAQIGNLKARLYLKSPGTVSKSEVEFLNNVLTVVEQNMSNERFSVEELAERVGVSRTNLHTKIKKVTGSSALALIKRIRFDEASRRLRETEDSIAEIGSCVGFSSPTYFATNFKAIFGLTPKNYRKKYKI